ncbi:uncharacterized protein LOC115244007 [Formica exsecta]|uniref:uncharacterized protein LOC115244007 n=1 Tax=Formica exsecta TaxID=72781 RepID=UPI001144DCFA|nr:uncharacterized protein LOC115244007 [Formica exsecta]
MIVTHTCKDFFFPDNHDGVIIEWHHKCSYDIMLMGKLEETVMFPYLRQCLERYNICKCQQFSASAHQLHYIILTENNQICYMRQDQLSICLPKEIDNIEIGRYFSSFKGTYYVPNKSLRKHYPKDTAAIAERLAKQ